MLQKTWGKTLEAGGAPFRFAPAESTRFFEPHGWTEAEWRATGEEALRLNRTMRFARFWALLGKLASKEKREEFRRMAGITLLART